jgi:hypothetical protein
MNNVTLFHQNINCSDCGTKLRPAKGAEIRLGLQDDNPTIRQAFAHAVQGDMSRKTVEPSLLPEWLEAETPDGSWVMVCDDCGQTQVHMREDTST